MKLEEFATKEIVNVVKMIIKQIEIQNGTGITINELKTLVYNIENNVITNREKSC